MFISEILENSQIRRSAALFATSPYCQIAANQRQPFVGHLSQARDLAASVGINLGRHTSQSTTSCTKCRPQFSTEFACVHGNRKKTLASLSQVHSLSVLHGCPRMGRAITSTGPRAMPRGAAAGRTLLLRHVDQARPPGIADPQNSRREFPGISEIMAGITRNL